MDFHRSTGTSRSFWCSRRLFAGLCRRICTLDTSCRHLSGNIPILCTARSPGPETLRAFQRYRSSAAVRADTGSRTRLCLGWWEANPGSSTNSPLLDAVQLQRRREKMPALCRLALFQTTQTLPCIHLHRLFLPCTSDCTRSAAAARTGWFLSPDF